MIDQHRCRSWILWLVLPLAGCALDQKLEGPGPPEVLSVQEKSPTAELHVEMARMLGRSGEHGGAEVHYRAALKMSPQLLEAQLGLARLLVARGEPQQACGWFERACQEHPKSAPACNDLGLCYAECGRTVDAVAAMRRATEIQPNEIRYRNNLARMLIAEDQTEEALRTLLAVHPPAVAHYNAGFLLQTHGKRAAAATQFQKAVSIDPSLAAAQHWSQEIARRDQLDAQTVQLPTRLPIAELQ